MEDWSDITSFAVPVKYMVTTTSGFLSMKYDVIDTSFEGQGRRVARCVTFVDADKVCAALNYVEGYEYVQRRGTHAG